MTDGEMLRQWADWLEEDPHFNSLSPQAISEMRRMAARLDAWDKELAHIAVENCDD